MLTNYPVSTLQGFTLTGTLTVSEGNHALYMVGASLLGHTSRVNDPFTSEKVTHIMADVEFKSKMQALQFEALKEMIEQRNAQVAKINAATGNRDSVFEAVAESNDNEEIAALRVQLAEIEEKFDALVNAEVDKIIGEATEGTDGLLEEVKDVDATVRAGLSYYKKLYDDGTVESLPKVVRLKGKTGGGGGGKRIRGYNVIVTIDGGDAMEFENFASAAKHLGADTSTLQEQFFAKAGVEKLKDAPDEVVFGMSWTEVDEDENESSHSAEVKAYRTGESGVATKSADEDADEDEPTEDDLNDDEDDDEDGLSAL